ncbi:MAG TPA: septal ring lytic transglycosylase RlpA family protein [Acidobacteriaceae bacterium]
MHAIRRSDIAKRPRRWFTLAGAVVAMFVGIAGARAASPADHLTAPEVAIHHHHWYEFGVASWYGKFFQGKTTASGVPYDENALTCAHRTLPLGSVLRVTNLRNHRSVVVTVNDRGPVPENRIIDLSHAAAQALGFSERGLAPVKVELLAPGSQLAQLQSPADLPPAR